MVDDSWSRWELPALRAVAEELDAQPHGSIVGTIAVLRRLTPVGDPDEDKWGRAIDRLDRAGYIESVRALWGRPYPQSVIRLTERGLRAAGVWPAPERLLDDLAALLEAEADHLEEEQPEKASRMRLAATAVGKIAGDIGTELVVKFAARAAGL